MKRNLILLLLLLALPLFDGCRNPERAAVTALAVESNTVVTALRSFVQWEKTHGASADTRARVDTAYRKVRAANLALAAAWIAYRNAAAATQANTSALEAVWKTAQAVSVLAEADFVNLIQTLLQ